ncbi:guanine nucleotide binding protein, alpha subunit [Mycena latifolia]|nr:guanine nucleotide binding protein, alpha subunit [Mycena latifolia]
MKQVKRYMSVFSDAEREEYKSAIHASVLATARAAVEGDAFDLGDAHTRDASSVLLRATEHTHTFTPDISTALHILWGNSDIQAAIRATRAFKNHGSFLYFIESLPRIAHPGYIPTDADILRCTHPPKPVTDVPFEVQVTYPPSSRVHELKMMLTSVHGERVGLPRKWIHHFSEVQAVIFLADLSSYDETILSEDSDEPVNKMREAIRQFEVICTSPYFRNATMALIMNKMDVFTQKLERSPLAAHFPEYSGDADPSAAAQYCIDCFTSSWASNPRANRRVWCTSAIDIDGMDVVLRGVGRFILEHHIRSTDSEWF